MTAGGHDEQREIERAVRQDVAEHRLEESERLPTTLTLSIPTVGLTHTIEGDVDLWLSAITRSTHNDATYAAL